MYYTLFDELPGNRGIASLIHDAIKRSIADGDLFPYRVFWRGDVFVVRFCFASVPHILQNVDQDVSALLHCSKVLFSTIWFEQCLEKEMENDWEEQWIFEQANIDRDVILSRVYGLN